jgi:membrane protein involved in colicin uptake
MLKLGNNFKETTKLFNERKLQVAEYQQFYSIELHEPLTIESTEEQFTALVDSLRDLKKTHDANQEKIRIENERLKKEADQKEKERLAEKEKQDAILKSEREKADALLESQRKQAAKEKAIADAKLKAANEENERLKRIEKEKQDAADKAERERIAAEKKAAKAPDKDKLTAWLESIKMNDIPTGLGNDAGTVGLTISNKFDSFKVWAKTQIENL